MTHGRIIPFVKASACGNDFLLISQSDSLGQINIFDLSRRICDRHNGVGADGVEWMSPIAGADVEIRLINADGSEAEISGNGTRCVAAYLYSETGKEGVRIQTGAGLKACTLTRQAGLDYEFEAAMGPASVGPELTVSTTGGVVRGLTVSMGNPHFVLFVDNFAENWQSSAAEIQRDAAFRAHGVNVELVAVDDTHNVRVRFFERGVGETQSSGTGSCAAAVASIAAGKTKSPVHVHAPGGTQMVRQEGAGVFLRGAARLVCRGEFFPDSV
ncbi:MAG TPA: diaminopimelate epimerase [Candidatus Binatia bacterium]|nr:diaminopimelate epimerase [Candidatus Binatia bacterium]